MSGPGRALVTGVSGQDGSYLADRLVADGWEVHGVSRPDDDPAPLPEGLRRHTLDFADREGLARLVAEVEPHQVYNLAGISSVARSWEAPVEVGEINGLAAVGLLEAAWQLQERTGRRVGVLQAASAEIFGEPAESPQTEHTPIRPVTPYGAAKAFAHTAVGVYRARGLHACSLILYNHESPRRPARFVTRKITRAAAAIADGSTETLRLGNLDARRDWGWAPDYVDAMVRAAAHEEADDYVVATGRSHAVRDLVDAAFAAAGIADWSGHVVVDPELFRPADATELVGDAGRARDRLGWAPTVGFTEMVARLVAADRG